MYTIELPDEGTFGFLLPPSQVPHVGKETFAGLTAYAKALSKLYNSSSVQRGDDLLELNDAQKNVQLTEIVTIDDNEASSAAPVLVQVDAA